jgi:hypothetical protein
VGFAFKTGATNAVPLAFAALWVERYHQSLGISGLHYLALGIGFLVSFGLIYIDHCRILTVRLSSWELNLAQKGLISATNI